MNFFYVLTSMLLSVSAFAANPVVPLKMLTSNKGVAIYEDACSNGENSADKKTLRDFIFKMEADKKSKLYKYEQAALKKRGDEAYAWVSDTVVAAHVRDGCTNSHNNVVGVIQTRLTNYNGLNIETHYVIEIKDTVEGTIRTLEIVTIKPYFVKSDKE